MNYPKLYDLALQQEVPNIPRISEEKIPVESYRGGYDFVRYGEPQGVINFEEVQGDREKLISHYYLRGYSTWPKEINSEFRKHIAYFRACLDFWEQFSKDRVFSKDEIYIRTLKEGPAFTELIKKARATCLRALSAETDTEIEEEYFFPEYKGYNSLIHERYLIHWDTTKDVDDVKYAFIPTKNVDTKEFRKGVRKLFDDFRIKDEELESIDLLREIKNTKMYDPTRERSTLMRHLWTSKVNTKSSYYARRSIVPIEPGNIRDTGIGDPSTILKVKLLNRMARVISERLPFCSNATARSANDRLLRVLRGNAFLHLDFKKFGLTFPRQLTNVVIEECGRYLGVDISDLIIDEFIIDIDGTPFKTERGSVLGWLDAINCIAVVSILYPLTKEYGFDFVTFNDDVEISKRTRDVRGSLNLLRTLIIGEMHYWDIPVSINKTYGSKGSVFLERYCYYDRHYGLDMYKEQLTVKAYAQSCVTKFPWKAKMLFAAAEQWTKSKYANDRCIETCPLEFSPKELNQSLWCGGWFIQLQNKLDMSLVTGHNDMISLGAKLSTWKTPNYTQGLYNAPPEGKIANAVEKKRAEAYSASFGRLQFDMNETTDDINIESDILSDTVLYYSADYNGTDMDYPDRIYRHLLRRRGPGKWG